MTRIYNVMVGATSYNYGEYIFSKVQRELKSQLGAGHLIKGDALLARKRAEQILDKGESVFSLNLVYGREAHFDGSGIYSGRSTQICPYLTNHPMYLDKELGLLDESTIICVTDRDYGEYLSAYYGKKALFLPMCGLTSSNKIEWESRKIDIFFPGSYLDKESIQKRIEKEVPEVLIPICKKMISVLEKDMSLSLDKAAIQVLETAGVPYTKETVKEFITEYGQLLIEYVNRSKRNEIVKGLVEAGLNVTVTGINWQVFKNTLPQSIQGNLQIVAENMNFCSVVDFIQDSKIVLNVSSGLRNGIHERATTAMLNGAVCFTEENTYTKEKLENHANVELYRYDNLKKMIKRVREILSDEELGSKISRAAMKYAKEEYTPRQFVINFLQNVETDD